MKKIVIIFLILFLIIGCKNKIHIDVQDQKCQSDEDCTVVAIRCDSCECGEPVNKAYVQKYIQQNIDLCRDYKGPVCDFICDKPYVKCMKDICSLSKTK